jgi:hypothetical protein
VPTVAPATHIGVRVDQVAARQSVRLRDGKTVFQDNDVANAKAVAGVRISNGNALSRGPLPYVSETLRLSRRTSATENTGASANCFMSMAVAVCAPAFAAPGTAPTAVDGAPGFPVAGATLGPVPDSGELVSSGALTDGGATGGVAGLPRLWISL